MAATYHGPPLNPRPERCPMVWNQKPECVPSLVPVSSSTIAPGRSPRCSATNSLNLTLPRKQIPCESLRSALGSPALRAISRICVFGNPPMGKVSAASCRCDRCARKYVWSLRASPDMMSLHGCLREVPFIPSSPCKVSASIPCTRSIAA